jgi:hypothetical protein
MEAPVIPRRETYQSVGNGAINEPKWAIMVVHGVGETQPGATVDAFLPALTTVDPELHLSSVHEELWLQELFREDMPHTEGDDADRRPGPSESIGGQRFITLFPVHLRRMSNREGAPGIVAEVYWADLSRVREGVLHILRGVFLTIFGLRDVADQAAHQPGKGARWLRSLLFSSAWVLRAPIAALNFFLLILLMVRVLTSDLARSRQLELPNMQVTGYLGLLALIGGSIAWLKLKERSPSWATFWGCVAFVGIWVIGMIALNLVVPQSALVLELDKRIRTVPYFKGVVDLTEAQAQAQLCLATVLWPISLAWDLESSLMLLAGLAWLAACLEAWYFGRKYVLPAVTAAYSAAMLQLTLWILIVPMLALIGMRFSFRDKVAIDQLSNMWKGLGLQYLLGSMIASVATLTWGVRLLLAYWGPSRGWLGNRPFPRLLVGSAIQTSLIGIVLIGSLYYEFMRAYDPQLNWLQSFPGEEIVVTLAAGFVLLVPVLPSSGLRTGLHIVADVINHFHRVPERFPAPWGGMLASKDDFVIRQRIEARFRSVLAEVLKSKDLTHLAVLAHSQGTIVSLDVLRQEVSSNKIQHLKDVTLLTMGSPFTHLYQHYFPRQYPPLGEEYWGHLRTRVQRWVNLYRIDDFVGTHVKGVDDSWPRNHPLPVGGHTNYWREREVLVILSGLLNRPAG